MNAKNSHSSLPRVVVALTFMLTSVAAMAIGGIAEPSCAQVICLSPADGTSAPRACLPVRQPYFMIRVYDPEFDADATAAARLSFLKTCTSARPSDLLHITGKYGKLPDDPIAF